MRVTVDSYPHLCLNLHFKLKIVEMETRAEKAIRTFRSGLNCAQAVLTTYSEHLEFDNSLALNLSCGFGGGMGRLQETCGAVTGAFMVLGIFNGKRYTDNASKKEVTYSMIQNLSEKFKSIHGATDCKSLLKCDLKTEQGQLFAKENNLFETVCEKCISDSIGIIEELIEKQN
jgi:C_GCAxxG_C_C family probable redox protein